MEEKIQLKKGEQILYSSRYIKDIETIVNHYIASCIITDKEREIYAMGEPIVSENQKELDDWFNFIDIGHKLRFEEYCIMMDVQHNLKKPQFLKSLNKLLYLVHIIARNGYIPDDGHSYFPQVRLNAEHLQKVIGDDYRRLLNTLISQRILIGKSDYIKGKESTTFFINPQFYNQIFVNKTENKEVIKYINKSSKLLDNLNDNPLYKNYNKSLKKINLKNEEKAISYLNNIIEKIKDTDKEIYYKKIKDKYLYCTGDNYIRLSTDNNKRIYHILTNTFRDFRKFTNIKFMLDICNSHPLLFNKFILDYYNINNSLLYNIINNIYYDNINNIWLYNNIYSPIYNPRHKSLKSLIDNMIKEGCFADIDIQKDAIHYIVMTSKGQLWHYLLDLCKHAELDIIDGMKIDKHSLKKKMFAEVFYSNIHQITFTTKDGNRVIKEYAKLFKKEYPSVFKIINENKPKGKEGELANNLMRLESQLFHAILERLYKKRGLDCISIHDAIVVLSTSDKKYKKEDIEKVMLDVYHSNSLFPTLDFTNYSLTEDL